jgi:DNA polymerase III epsilon subunit-like protein
MIIVDVETTGLNPEIHSILSIGAVDFSNPSNQFYEECRIWHGAEIKPEALAVNGFTEEEARSPGKKPLRKIMKEFVLWITQIHDRTLAGENPSFDRDFLANSIERSDLDFRLGHRMVDLHSLSYIHHLHCGIPVPLKNGRTDLDCNKTFAYAGLPEKSVPHHALDVCAKMEAEAFSRLIYGKILFEEFRKYSIPEHIKW